MNFCFFFLSFSVNDEWLEGQCNGKIGIFPSTFVKALNGDRNVNECSTNSYN